MQLSTGQEAKAEGRIIVASLSASFIFMTDPEQLRAGPRSRSAAAKSLAEAGSIVRWTSLRDRMSAPEAYRRTLKITVTLGDAGATNKSDSCAPKNSS